MFDNEESNKPVANPFGASQVAQRVAGALSDATSTREVAEIQSAMVIAKRFPRDQKAAVDRILNACTRPSLAESAIYQYARGGTDISGPSIRLAEAVAQNWGNIRTGIDIIGGTRESSECIAYAWDLESNYRDEKRFTVRHWRDTKKGGYQLQDERDIYELIANLGARRKRACILAVIPKDVVEMAEKQCDVTMRTNIEVTPELIKKLCESFEAFGISKKQIEMRIQRSPESITPAQVVNMKKIYASLRDGMSEASDWFEPEPETGMDKFKAGVEKRAAGAPEKGKTGEGSGKVEKTPPVPASQAAETSLSLSEVTVKLIKAFERATDIDVLQADATLIETLPEAEQEDARAAYIARLDALGVK